MFPGSLCDVAGLAVGHHTEQARATGCTVVLCPQGAVCGVDVRGAAPGTRETDLLRPDNLVEQVHAVLLSGGSAFGLDAAGGVMRWLDEHGHGFPVGPARVPIVPAAVLFDLWIGDARIRPGADSGFAACTAARSAPPAQGSVGAGAGAAVGKLFGIERAMKGGIGTASVRVGAVTVAALIAVNAIGDVVDTRTGAVIAGARTADGRQRLDSMAALLRGELPARALAGMATTIGVVATDAALTKAQASKLATMAHDGLAHSIRPVHTMTDGDTLFALATGASGKPGDMTVLGAMAAEATARAVLNAVHAASGLPGLPSAREL
ncbi:P1 family peptidase [Rubrivivax sp. RP6-9]|uniref:P1 family peptidase n=1 Tax=Rubrivivax sp. RP6-9 TaxID=3415750 RepID=UPI003CC52C48